MATASGQIGTGDTSPHHQAEVKQKTVVAPLVTRSKKRKKPPIVTRPNVLPEDDDQRQSVTLGGFLFKRDGVGWECRDVIYIEDPITRKRARKRPYLAHLSRTNYEKMKSKCPTPEALTDALTEWAKNRKEKKKLASK